MSDQVDTTEAADGQSRLTVGLAADELHHTLCDALAGWKYIRETHGDLYGVGWDRVQSRLEAQIKTNAGRLRKAANADVTGLAPREDDK